MNKHFPLYTLVFIGGAAVLAIEILGTRILGPFYGVSLFLWSALITVTLAALSVGYVVGGRWADRGPRYSRLALVLAGAGLWLLLVPWIKRPLLDLMAPVGLRTAVLVTSSVLFFVPLALLGMVSPYAIRLKAASLDEVGKTAGDIYAVSTVASVIAALLTGFVLIPNVGVSRLILLIGVLLLLGAVIALVAGRESKKTATVTLAMMLAGGVVAWMIPTDQPDPERGLLAIEQSPYAEIRVLDADQKRFLLIDGGTHTIVNPETWDSHHTYAVALEVVKYLFEDPGKVVVVGLGGGSVIKSFAASHWEVHAVEIDPVVVRVAREYFGLEENDATIHTMDGRNFFARHETRYDLIIMDAFGSSAIPFHLVTEEFFALAKSRVADGGILAINLESRGWEGVLVKSVAATLKTQFEHVLALPTQEPPDAIGNVILIASDREMYFPPEKLPVPFNYLEDPYEHWRVVELNHAWLNRFEPEPGQVLTDDLNPVDVWAEAINLEARKSLLEYFGEGEPSW